MSPARSSAARHTESVRSAELLTRGPQAVCIGAKFHKATSEVRRLEENLGRIDFQCTPWLKFGRNRMRRGREFVQLAGPWQPRALAGPHPEHCQRAGGRLAARSGWNITLYAARSRLDQIRFSCPNTHFSAKFKIYEKIIFSQAIFANFHRICEKKRRHLVKFLRIS